MSSIAYTLKTPITVSGNKIEKIVLTEPDFESICQLGLPADQTDQKARLELMRKYLSFCSGLSDEAVGALKMRDAMALLKELSSFFTDME